MMTESINTKATERSETTMLTTTRMMGVEGVVLLETTILI